jgi:DNA-binding transcriptional LysR family regulator
MDLLQQMRFFMVVAEEEGFAAAARRLQQSPPNMTRAVAGLEQRLGVKLLNRTTRYVRVTDAGQRYLEDVRRILAEVETAEEAVAGVNAIPRGLLSVTAPVLFGRMFVMPGIVEFLERYPDMRVEGVFLDRTVNLLEEGLDVGVRIGELPDSGMRALRVGAVRRVLVASPEYLARREVPQTPDALALHSLISSSAGNFQGGWRFVVSGREQNVRISPRLTVTTNDAAIEAALEGFGITSVLSYQVAAHVAAGRLKIVLAQFEGEARPIHVIHREGSRSPSKVRTFIDLLAERLRIDKSLSMAGLPG